MKLPNGDEAIIDSAKLRDYCLNLSHLRGRHKARVFKAVLGISAEDAGIVRAALALAAMENEALQGVSDQFGSRYVVDFQLSHLDRSAMIRSCWIVRNGELTPRFVTCFVL